MDQARQQTRWFPAMVGNHVADIVERYGMDSPDIPAFLTAYIEGRKGYDYKEHADKDADHLDFISEDIIDAFGIFGDVDQHIAKLKELEAAGVTQFNIYLMCGEEERIVAEYGEKDHPRLSANRSLCVTCRGDSVTSPVMDPQSRPGFTSFVRLLVILRPQRSFSLICLREQTMAIDSIRQMTVEEYIAFDEATRDTRYEYIDGEVIADARWHA